MNMIVIHGEDDRMVFDLQDQIDPYLIDGIGTITELVDYVRRMSRVLMLHCRN